MSKRPVIILLLFVAAICVLAGFYFSAANRARPRPREKTDMEILGDLDACCRRKHVKAAQYDHFARVAAAEHRIREASLFRAMAFAERLQECNCATVIVRLGGSYRPPTRVRVFREQTRRNLERSIDYNRRILKEGRGMEIDRARARGNRLAAEVLIRASAADVRHIVLMERCLDRCGHAASRGYLVCPTCGNLASRGSSDFYCPCCLTDGRRFIHIE